MGNVGLKEALQHRLDCWQEKERTTACARDGWTIIEECPQ